MHTIKFKGCVAQQDNRTLSITVEKAGYQKITYDCKERLSGKELRTVVNRYLTQVMQ